MSKISIISVIILAFVVTFSLFYGLTNKNPIIAGYNFLYADITSSANVPENPVNLFAQALKEKEAELDAREVELEEAEERSNKKFVYVSIFALFLLILIIFNFYFDFNRKNKNK